MGEVRAQLYAAHDIGYLNLETFKDLKFKAEEVSKLLYAFIRKVKTASAGGLQYKREPNPELVALQKEIAQYVPAQYRQRL